MFCFLPFLVAVHAGYDKQSHQSSIDSQVFAENRGFYLANLHSTPPVRRSPSEYCIDVWYEKKLMWLPDGEKKEKLCLFFLTEYTNVTDRRTHKHRTSA